MKKHLIRWAAALLCLGVLAAGSVAAYHWWLDGKLVGTWLSYAGGCPLGDRIELYSDGTFRLSDEAPGQRIVTWEDQLHGQYVPAEHGTWRVTAYDPSEGRYWDETIRRELILTYDDGSEERMGMELSFERLETSAWGFCLSTCVGEGGGGYIRTGDPSQP